MSGHRLDQTHEKLLGSSIEEQLMMEEILEMLAAEDPPNQSADAGVGAGSNGENNDTNDGNATNEGGSGTNNSGDNYTNNEGEEGANTRHQAGEDCPMGRDDPERSGLGGNPPARTPAPPERYLQQYDDEEEAELEEKMPAEKIPEQEQKQEEDRAEAVGSAQQQPLSMGESSLMSLAHAAAPIAMAPMQSDPFPMGPPFQYFPSSLQPTTPPLIPPMAASGPPPLHPTTRTANPGRVPPQLPATLLPPPQGATPTTQPSVAAAPASAAHAAPATTSHVLPTGQQVHVMNAAEFDEMRRKVRMQMASRRYRKRKKEEAKQQKQQLQQLQTELARLQELEAQASQYQQRSLASLQAELAAREQEVAQLSAQLHAAALEELDWVDKIRKHLDK